MGEGCEGVEGVLPLPKGAFELWSGDMGLRRCRPKELPACMLSAVELSKERRGAMFNSCSSEMMPMSETLETLEALDGGYESSNLREARTRAGERMGLEGLGIAR